MTVAIIGAGASAEGWGKQKFDLSIGVNDCYKFGYHPDQLVLINFERKFIPSRLKVILATRPQKLWTHTSTWIKHFRNGEVIKLAPFNGYVRSKDLIYSSKTSPMVAISLAYKQGATQIVLYGVDMVNHPAYRSGTKHGDYEVKQYLRLFDELYRKGVTVMLGAKGSTFENKLPIWNSQS
jgi:hypothetical protein